MRLLVAGFTVSNYGSFLNFVAVSLYAFQVTGGALGTGLFMALRLASGFVAGTVAGHLVSRYPRRALIVGSELAQAAGLAVLALGPAGAQAELLFALAVVLGVGRTITQVALRSSIPDLVGPENRVRANALLVTGRSIAMIAGYSSAGVLVAVLDFRTVFLIDAASFVVSALTVALVRLSWNPPRPPSAPRSPAPGNEPHEPEPEPGGTATATPVPTAAAPTTAAPARDRGPGLRGSVREGVAALRVLPVLGAMVSIRFVDAFGSASHNVGLPVLASLPGGGGAATMSVFWASWAAGMLLVSQVVIRWVDESRLTERAFAAATVSMSVFFVIAFLPVPVAVLAVAAFLAGVSDAVAEIAYTSRLQSTPEHQRGFVFGISAMAESGGFGLGMVVSAVLLESLAPVAVVSLLHGAACTIAVAFLVTVVMRRRRVDRAAAGTLPP